MRFLSTLIGRLRREDGVALYAAVGTLAVTSVLAGTVATGAVHLSDETIEDTNSKRAFAAAEAGVRAATYRINKLAPRNNLCLTDVPTAPVDGVCPPFHESLTNGASYKYYISPILNEDERCAGLPLQIREDGILTVVQRCITATGTVHGVKRRVQVRVAAYQGAPIFGLGGVLGVDGVEVNNNSNIDGVLGSNGQITMGNGNTVTGGFEISASAPNPTMGNSNNTGSVTRRTTAEGPWVLAPVDVGDSATSNDNARLTNGLDPLISSTYTPATRTLAVGNNGSVTLGGGTYNFCSISFSNGGSIMIAPTAKVRIFIDSPDRPESGCAAGSGSILTGSNSIRINAGGLPENLMIYVFGKAENGTANGLIDFKNNVTMRAGLYAPQSDVEFKNEATIVGAVAGRSVKFKNSVDFEWPETFDEMGLRGRTVAIYFRSAWRECTPSPTDPADPDSGC